MALTRTLHPTGRGGGSGDLRHGNLTEILRQVRDHGPSSRHDIARGCGLGISTMTDLVGELRRRGLVRELDAVRRLGAGRPTRPIALDGDRWCVLGVEVDLLQIAFVATTVGGRELWRDQVAAPLMRSGPEAGYALLSDALGSQLRRIPTDKTWWPSRSPSPRTSAATRQRLTGRRRWAGAACRWSGCSTTLCTPRAVRTSRSGWSSRATWPPCTRCVRSCPRPAVPPRSTSLGCASSAAASSWTARSSTANGGAGDFGHAGVDPSGPLCVCGRRGCLESILGLSSLLSSSDLVSTAEAERLITFEPVRAVRLLIDEADSGHPQVLEVLAAGGSALGTALDTIIGTVNPATVVLGGYLGMLQPFLQPTLDQRLAVRFGREAFASTRIVTLAEVVPRVLLGAGLAGRDRCLADPLALTHVL